EDLLRTGYVFRPAAARREFQMGDLRQRMNSGVGAPRAADLDLSIEEIFSGLAQFTGDRAGVRLLLPSAVTSAVVFKGEFPGSHLNIPPIDLHSAFRLWLDHRRAVAFAPLSARGAEVLPPLARRVDRLTTVFGDALADCGQHGRVYRNA